MIVEGAYGQLKGRWSLLLRKSEENLYQTKLATLACMVLHNMCLENNDELSEIFNLTMHPTTYQKRDWETICGLLLMKISKKIIDPEKNESDKVRQIIIKSCRRNTRTLANEHKCLLKIT